MRLVTLYSGPLDGKTVHVDGHEYEGQAEVGGRRPVYRLRDGRFCFDHYAAMSWGDLCQREAQRLEAEARRQGFDIKRGSDM